MKILKKELWGKGWRLKGGMKMLENMKKRIGWSLRIGERKINWRRFLIRSNEKGIIENEIKKIRKFLERRR